MDNGAHHQGKVYLPESPLYLDLSWKSNPDGLAQHVGLFRLDLHGLLQGGYIRHDPVNSGGPVLRLRVVRTTDGLFYIQTRRNGPRFQLPASGDTRTI